LDPFGIQGDIAQPVKAARLRAGWACVLLAAALFAAAFLAAAFLAAAFFAAAFCVAVVCVVAFGVVAVGVVAVVDDEPAHVDLAIVSVSSVTAPFRANTRPSTVAPVVTVMLVNAIKVPRKVEPVPSVAELPTCQKTLQDWAPLIMLT
jgi:hypothetical protein